MKSLVQSSLLFVVVAVIISGILLGVSSLKISPSLTPKEKNISSNLTKEILTIKINQTKEISLCNETYLNEFRCSNNIKQQKYQFKNCSVIWKNLDYCKYGCEKGECKEEPYNLFICDNLSYHISSIKLSNKIANEYVKGFYTFTAKPNTTFLLIWLQVTNLGNVSKYYHLFNGELITDKNIYKEWKAPLGIYSEEYNPKISSNEEIQLYNCSYGEPWNLPPNTTTSICEEFELLQDERPLVIKLNAIGENCSKTINISLFSVEKVSKLLENQTQLKTFTVSRVIDGDTFELQTGERVRLLGINTPEKGQNCYEEAKQRLRELVEGKEVVLEKDIDDKDQYGRLLRYVFIDNNFVNLLLVKEGLANVYIVEPNVKYAKEFKEAEDYAKNNQIGCLWQVSKLTCANCIGIYYFHYNAKGDDCYNLNDEYVIFKNTCDFECNLTNWSVKDEGNHIYTFPPFILGGGKTVTLYTGCGNNTESELYWCNCCYSCNAVWNNDGDTLYLRDPEGNLILKYSY